MANEFTKLFNSIITSSIWSEDDKTRLMWITMLASSDWNGFVTGSIPGMAAMARMSLGDAEKSIKALMAPDSYSRSKEYEGRRLLECDGGWLIVNYAKYRQKRDPEIRRKQNREAKRRERSQQDVSKMSANVSHSQPESAHIDIDIDKDKDKDFKNYSDNDMELSRLLFELIQKNRPEYSEPNFDRWAEEVRRLREIDKKSPEQIEAVIKWAQADSFWWKNTLSPASLRKKSKTDGVKRFDRIEIQMEIAKNGRNSGNSTKSNEQYIR